MSRSSEARPFDLNIEEVLEHWDGREALRKLIANALDERQLADVVQKLGVGVGPRPPPRVHRKGDGRRWRVITSAAVRSVLSRRN